MVKPEITIKLSYGTIEILKTIKEWLGNPKNLKDSAIKDMIVRLENWDDLWLSYAIVSLELDNQIIRGFNNVEILKKYLLQEDLIKIIKSSNQVGTANEIALHIAPLWKEDSIPVGSLSEKIHYIRDLILLRCIYEIS